MLSEQLRLSVRVRKDVLVGIDLDRPAAVYPRADIWVPAPPGRYPPPESAPGAPFADPNLKLVVLEELRSRGVIELGTPEDLCMHVLGRYVDLEREGHDFMPACRDYLVAYPLTSAQLQAVGSLCLDGGLEIYRYMSYHWDGESDGFDVRSLQGIEHCVNLREFDINAMCGSLDLTPLRGLPALETLGLSCGPHDGEDALLALPQLKTFTCFDDTLRDPSIRSALESRGVRVKVYR